MIGFVGVGFGSSLRKDELDGKRRRTCVTGNRWRMMAGEEKVTSESDVIVIGSGIGGLGTAALFARRGLDVTVLESHVHAGGAAHAFTRSGYTFDSGPSLFSGMSMRPSGNPLAHLLDAVGEDCEWIRYDVWGVTIPEGSFPTRVGAEDILKLVCLKKNSEEEKEEVIAQWDRLYKRIVVLNKASRVVPTAAVRTDLLAAVTISRYLPKMAATASSAPLLMRPFSEILDDEKITDPLLRNWIDLLCFCLSGIPADGTPTVEAAFMLHDFYEQGAVLEYPRGGAGSLVEALVRGVTKRGGRVLTNRHVKSLVMDGNRVAGVETTRGDIFRARKYVVSNLSAWDTHKLYPPGLSSETNDKWLKTLSVTPECKSFMHLHLGFDATGLDPLELHYIHVDDWTVGVDAPSNVVLISIPSVVDPSLAPAGKHVLHAYTPGSEPFDEWIGLERGTEEYEAKKKQRAEILWKAVENVIPDIRKRIEVEMVGTPLTHQRFLRRHRGSYGPAMRAGKETFPFADTPMQGLLRCGDSVFPGIGLPAVAAGALITVNSKSSVFEHLKLMDEIGV